MELTKNYYISIDSLGNNKGLFPPGIWSLEEIKKKKTGGEFLILISEDFYHTFLQDSRKLVDFSRPKFKKEKLSELIEEDILNWSDEELINKFPLYCETIEIPNYKRTLTQEQEDIKTLAEALKSILDVPIMIPVETEKSSFNFYKIQEIIDRYTIE